MIYPSFNGCSRQQGMILVDALIAILIFSIGILGMVAMAGVAIKFASDAQYRAGAAMYADQVIAQMWGSDPSTLATNFKSPSGAAFTAWASAVSLPGVSTSANQPTITVDSSTSSNLVTVTVNWQAPNDKSAHSYVSVTQVTR